MSDDLLFANNADIAPSIQQQAAAIVEPIDLLDSLTSTSTSVPPTNQSLQDELQTAPKDVSGVSSQLIIEPASPPPLRSTSSGEDLTTTILDMDAATPRRGTANAAAVDEPPNTSLTTTTAAVVTSERKQVLLLRARHDRRRWLTIVPLPFRVSTLHDPEATRLLDTHVGRQAPAVARVLSLLYNADDEGEASDQDSWAHVNGILDSCGVIPDAEPGWTSNDESNNATKSSLAFPTASLLLSQELQRLESMIPSPIAEWSHQHELQTVQSYQTFWQRLNDATAAPLVQTIRRFCARFVAENDAAEDDDKLVSILAAQLQSFVTSTCATMLAHPLWVGSSPAANTTPDIARRSLESLVYAHCSTRLERVLLQQSRHLDASLLRSNGNNKPNSEQEEWRDRLASLAFVTPAHLEIACLVFDNLDDAGSTRVEELLAIPIEILQSVDRYFAPFEKLQRLWALYKAVNASLTLALNRSTNATADAHNKLPSADDVLPTIILCVIRANPARLQYNLRLIEMFCLPEDLRGEAGYAYTNLYGAVQFLRDLNISADDTTANGPTLSISPEEFRKSLEASRASANERFNLQQAKPVQPTKAFAHVDTEVPHFRAQVQPIPPEAIGDARRRGEPISLDWALQWQKENRGPGFVSNGDEDDSELVARTAVTNSASSSPASNRAVPRRAAIDEAMEGLPAGFTRTYSFLTSSPEDIKLSDLPLLLSEYRMLVHSTETLIAQRAARIATSRRDRLDRTGEEVYATVREIDPMLLPRKHPDSPKSSPWPSPQPAKSLAK
jgi:Vacuolar sorting protein 9 (VPS9) domain